MAYKQVIFFKGLIEGKITFIGIIQYHKYIIKHPDTLLNMTLELIKPW